MLTNNQKLEVCKFYIGNIMGRDTSIMSQYLEPVGNEFYITYHTDQGQWKFAVTMTDNDLVWKGWLKDSKPPKWGRTRYEDLEKYTIGVDNSSVTLGDFGVIKV